MTHRIRDRWYRSALCARFPNLPWITDPHMVAPAAVEAMRTVCRACRVHDACEAAVRDEAITAGFWAGAYRHRLIPYPRRDQPGTQVRSSLSGGAA